MNRFHPTRKTPATLIAFTLCIGLVPASLAASPAHNPQKTGGVRPDAEMRASNSQPFRITVHLNGVPVANATITITSDDGMTVASGSTSSQGVFSTTLDAGIYTVTATSPSGSATGSVTIVQSTTLAALALDL